MKRRNKFGNVATVVDGIRFDSKAEAKRYGELRILERAGEITGLTCQPKFEIVVLGKKVATYRGDFQYRDAAAHRTVIEDVKGVQTEAFKIKWALLQTLYPNIAWRIVPAKNVRPS